ncbi:M23 family metallopeptidase [Paenibacillus sp. IB182496]|uniref:M23 family metallopeptidase n=1 Tax=Paenibacillus sabuli TaxID=2772509 RepID=A0A927BSW8_9BACL|nr:M23 family metallopeptidase [Paenibacillus sabuli]MBD2846177.1 M23 family metallopeptidase [Paenibacillus sabuli]
MTSQWACDSSFVVSSSYGERVHPVYGTVKFHKGIDLVASPPDRILYAFVPGVVVHAGEGQTGSGFGKMGLVVAIRDEAGYLHVYAHLSAVAVKRGASIRKGEAIGRQGSTGLSTGPHLHYEVRKRSQPSYGWTADASGVVDPTAYVLRYNQEKEEEPMTAEERQLLQGMHAQLGAQAARIADLEQERALQQRRMERQQQELEELEKLQRMSPPAWAEAAVRAAAQAGLVDSPEQGSYDFYRMLTVLHRAQAIG